MGYCTPFPIHRPFIPRHPTLLGLPGLCMLPRPNITTSYMSQFYRIEN
jgi:hypothetical protein